MYLINGSLYMHYEYTKKVCFFIHFVLMFHCKFVIVTYSFGKMTSHKCKLNFMKQVSS